MPRVALPIVILRQRCRLRELRGERKLQELAEVSGLNPAVLSQLEHGRIPRVDWLDGMERAYGPREEWYGVVIEVPS